jgi:hypothetical protein
MANVLVKIYRGRLDHSRYLPTAYCLLYHASDLKAGALAQFTKIELCNFDKFICLFYVVFLFAIFVATTLRILHI